MNLKFAVMSVCLSLILLGGCDQQAARRNQGRKQFKIALDAFREVELGYVPASTAPTTQAAKQSQSTRQSTQAYRQEKLALAMAALDPILAKGTESQKVAARRLASDIQASDARYKLREILNAWTTVSERSVVLMSYLVAVGRTHAQVHHLRTDDANLLEALRKKLRQTNLELDRSEQQGEQVDAKSLAYYKKIQQLQAQVNKHKAKTQQLKGQAFVATSSQKWRLLDQAAQAERAASKTAAQLQVQTAYRNKVQAERTLLTEKIDFTLEFLDELEQQIEQTHQRQNQLVKDQEKAKARLKQAEQKCVDELKNLVAQFSKDIEPLFKEMEQEMDQALVFLEACQTARGDVKRAVDFEYLTKLVVKINLQSSILMTFHDLGSKFKLLLQRSKQVKGKQLLADRMDFFQSTFNRMSQAQNVIYQRTLKTIAQAREQAAKVIENTDGETPQGQAAAKLNALIETYSQRIETFRLS